MKYLKTEIHIHRHVQCPNCEKAYSLSHTENNCTNCGRSLVISAKPIETCPFCGQFLVYHPIPFNCDRDDLTIIVLTTRPHGRENMLIQDDDGDWWYIKYDKEHGELIKIEPVNDPAGLCNSYKEDYRKQIARLTHHADLLAGIASQFRDEGGDDDQRRSDTRV